MAKELTDFVLETLQSRFVQRLFFTFSFMHVYPQGYNRDIARAISNGNILVTTDASLISSTPNAVRGDGAYTCDTPPGQQHYLYINPIYTTQVHNERHIKKAMSARERASLRGTIIHETTHALQDYQRVNLSPRQAESVAYFAGAITRRQWGYSSPGGIYNPEQSAHAYSLHMADLFLRQPQGQQITIPPDQITTLSRLVSHGTPSRYVFNGI